MPDDERLQELLPPDPDFVFYLDTDNGEITCHAVARVGQTEYEIPHEDDGLPWDIEQEAQIFEEIQNYLPEWEPETHLFYRGEDEDCIYYFLENGVNRLLELGEVHSTDRFRSLKIRPTTRISVGVSLKSEIMDLNISSEDISKKELLEILTSYKKKKHFHRLRSGDFIRMDDENLKTLDLIMNSMHLKPKDFVKEKLQIPLYRAFYLDKLLEENEGIYVHRDSRFRKLVKEFKTVKESDYEVPESLTGIMRNYQIYGHKWLRTLGNSGFGGILADDMGLGKTLQVISVFLADEPELPSPTIF